MPPGTATAVTFSHMNPTSAPPKHETDDFGSGTLWSKPVVAVGSTSPATVFAARAKSRGIRSALFQSTDSEISGHDSPGPGRYRASRLADHDLREESPRKTGFRWDTEDTTASGLVDGVTGMYISEFTRLAGDF